VSDWGTPLGTLVDANGVAILDLGNHGIDGSTACEGSEPDPREAALIAAAPEMEALLREFEWRPAYSDPPGTKRRCLTCAADHVCGEPHDPGCRVAALLARIDAAKGQGP
jgi:hypothetical protein